MSKNLLFTYIIVGLILSLAFSLFNCNPPSAYAITFKPTFDSIMWNDPNTGYGTGIWHHPLPDTNLAVVSWGFWADSVGGTFVPSGSDTVPYSDIYDYKFRIPQGNYQFYIGPLHKPASSNVLLWETWGAWKIDASKTITFAATTEYFLVMLDTMNTWDFNTGYKNDGYQYMYYSTGKPTNFWPSYTMDYYCGIQGLDSVYKQFHIDTAYREDGLYIRPGLMYPIMCTQSFDVGIKVNILGAMELGPWTIETKE